MWSALYILLNELVSNGTVGCLLPGFVCFPIFIFGKLTSQTLETHISCCSDVWIRLFFSIFNNEDRQQYSCIHICQMLYRCGKNRQRHSYEDSEQIKAISFLKLNTLFLAMEVYLYSRYRRSSIVDSIQRCDHFLHLLYYFKLWDICFVCRYIFYYKLDFFFKWKFLEMLAVSVDWFSLCYVLVRCETKVLFMYTEIFVPRYTVIILHSLTMRNISLVNLFL